MTAESLNEKKLNTYTFIILSFLLLSRMISMWLIPLTDVTEARYGEIARKMLETGDWITLQHNYGIPFWAKPPLSTWLSALSMKFFGISEFTVRLPALLLSIAILWLIWDFAKTYKGSVAARVATLVLAGTFYFFLDAGTVMTDPALIFCTTLSMVAFWHALEGKKIWSYLFFVGLGLGLLAKGPIAVVLIAFPIFFWILFKGKWHQVWKHLPWFKGSLIALAIALPWYILAELKTPGFLNYFIIGEHFNRFLTPGWTGDKYGMAHNEPWGMIWVYALGGMFPWCILGLFWLIKNWKKIPSLFKDDRGWGLYLFICMMGPLVFFTFASNIIYTYVFPSLPAYALFFTEAWDKTRNQFNSIKWILFGSLVCGLIFLTVTLIFKIKPELVSKTQKPIVTAWLKQKPSPGSSLIYWDYKIDHSAQFYSGGKIKAANNLEGIRPLLSAVLENYLVVKSNELQDLPPMILAECNKVFAVKFRENSTLLYHCPASKLSSM